MQPASAAVSTHTQAHTRSPEPLKLPPGTLALSLHGQGTLATSDRCCGGGQRGQGLADHVTRAATRERGGEGSPQSCWAGPGPSAAPPSTAHLPSTPPPPQTVAVNPRIPRALPLCAAALSRARLQDALGGFLLRDLLQAMAGGLVGPGRGPRGGGRAGDPLTSDPSTSGLNLRVQLCTCVAWK